MIKLSGNRVMVLRDQTQEQTDGGIFLLKKSQKTKQTGTVIAVGETANQSLKDKSVVFDPNCGTRFDHEGVEYLLIYQSDIWAKFKN